MADRRSNVTKMGVVADAAPTPDDAEESMVPAPPIGQKYTLNALIAAGIIGFVAGRILGR